MQVIFTRILIQQYGKYQRRPRNGSFNERPRKEGTLPQHQTPGGQPVSDSTPAKLRSDQQTTPASSLAHAEPAARQGALTVTIHGYQTRYQPRKSKSS